MLTEEQALLLAQNVAELTEEQLTLLLQWTTNKMNEITLKLAEGEKELNKRANTITRLSEDNIKLCAEFSEALDFITTHGLQQRFYLARKRRLAELAKQRGTPFIN
jgi:hypothetical protein